MSTFSGGGAPVHRGRRAALVARVRPGAGVRTRISDDRLWLPYAATHYLAVTSDQTVLDEIVPFLDGPALRPGQNNASFVPGAATQRGTLFEHCARAIDRSLTVGAHGLPLIGTGDWNDGMNRVGVNGKGESVWLAWFLHTNLIAWASLAAARGEHARAASWKAHASAIKVAVEREAWDGAWYTRAFFDDGTALGVAGGDACAITAIAQSWSVMSGAGDPARVRQAMGAVDEQLVRRRDNLSPPADSALRPHGARTRLYQRLRARCPRERRPVHTCRRLDSNRIRRSSATAIEPRHCSAC